jgi:hypothetical protein
LAQFKDEFGRQWHLRLDVPTIRRVRKRTNYDLAKMFTELGLVELTADVCLLVDVLAGLCQGQIEEQGLTEEDFAVGLVGDAIEAAVHSLVDAGIDFLPQAQRSVNRALWEKVTQVGLAMEQTILERIETIDPTQLNGRSLASSGMN